MYGLSRNPFTQLAGRSARLKSAEETDDDRKKREEEEATRARKAKRAKKADDEDDEGDDDTDEEDNKDPNMHAARVRERRRVRAILTSEPGKLNPHGAFYLATETARPRRQVVELLTAIGAPVSSKRGDSLRDRMAATESPAVGPGSASPAPNLAQAIIAAGKKRRGEV